MIDCGKNQLNLLKKNEIINIILYIIIQAFFAGYMANEEGRLDWAAHSFAVIFGLHGIFTSLNISFIALFFVSVLVSITILLCILIIHVFYRRILSQVLVKKCVMSIKKNSLVTVIKLYSIQVFVFGTLMLFGCLSYYTRQYSLYQIIILILWLLAGILAISIILIQRKLTISLKRKEIINAVLYIFNILFIIKFLVMPVVYQNMNRDVYLIFIESFFVSVLISIFSVPIIKLFKIRKLIDRLKKYNIMYIILYSFIQAFMVGLSSAICYNSVRWNDLGMFIHPASMMFFVLMIVYSILFSLMIVFCVFAIRYITVSIYGKIKK
jgi:hypothetical protein